MDINIREHIISNFKDNTIEEIKESINDSISESDEVTLPGLGVFFELLWKNSDNELKEEILNNIKKGL